MNVTNSDLTEFTSRHFASDRFRALCMLYTQLRLLKEILSLFGQGYISFGPTKQQDT